jgi:hypothetical protein
MKSRRFLLAFYPRAWRRRYGDEFAQLLEDLDAEQPGDGLKRTFDVLLNVGSIQLAWRPAAATPFLVFLVSGAMATVWVLAHVSATTQRMAISTPWNFGRNPIIVRSAHHTFSSNSFATRKAADGKPIVRIRATSRDGRKVTLYCQGEKCRAHPRR